MQITNAQITLLVNGEEKTFSEEELVAILGKHFFDTTTEQKIHNYISGPKEGEPFEINPKDIEWSLFQIPRKDIKQEKMRRLILKALYKVKENPKRYDKIFWTLWPVKYWEYMTCYKLENLAFDFGGHLANWVEQALEWAQRIKNGESWEEICNYADTANWYRLVKWKDGYSRRIGGSCKSDNNHPASYVDIIYIEPQIDLYLTVPLIVLYHK